MRTSWSPMTMVRAVMKNSAATCPARGPWSRRVSRPTENAPSRLTSTEARR